LNDFGADKDNDSHILTLAEILKEWHNLSYEWIKLPSLLKRNLNIKVKEMVSNPNTPVHALRFDYKQAALILKDINATINIIPKEKLQEILPMLANSTKSLSDIEKSFKNIQNTMSFISDNMVDKDQMLDKAENVNADLVMDSGNVVIFKINDYEAMQEMGCYSNWCFSQAGSEEHWENYAHLGYVYVIYNLNVQTEDARFLMVYLPDVGDLFMSNNQRYEEVYGESGDLYLHSIGIDSNKLR